MAPFTSFLPAPQSLATASPPIKVLQIIHSDEGGGVEALAGMISEGLYRRGIRVETAFLYPSISAGSSTKLAGIARTAWHIFKARPDVMIGYQSTASVMVGLIGWLAGCRQRIVHQTAMPSEVHPLVRSLDAASGAIGLYSANITNSIETENAFSSYSRLYRRYIRRIIHGLEVPAATKNREELMSHYGIPNDKAIIFNAGRLSDQKAQHRILHALPTIPDARLILAGKGPRETDLKELAVRLGVSDRVHFVGVVPRQEVANLLAASDLFVFPSTWETFGLAVAEASLAGVPVVCSDMPVLREVLESERTSHAVFVDTSNIPALAQAINAQLVEPDIIQRSKAASRLLSEKYSIDKMVDSYFNLVARETCAKPEGANRAPILRTIMRLIKARQWRISSWQGAPSK